MITVIQSQIVSDVEAYEGRVLVVEVADGKVSLRRVNGEKSGEPTLVLPEKHFSPWSVTSVYCTSFDEIILVNDVADTRDKDAFMRQSFSCSEGCIAEIGWGETPDDCAMVSFVPTKASEPLHFDRADRSANFIDEAIPGFAAKRLKYVDARRKALRDIVPLDSIAELEKQVDLLSTLVFTLADKLPEAERPAWYEAFKGVVSANSSTAFKASALNIADIEATKSKIRKIQVQYFTEKNA